MQQNAWFQLGASCKNNVPRLLVIALLAFSVCTVAQTASPLHPGATNMIYTCPEPAAYPKLGTSHKIVAASWPNGTVFDFFASRTPWDKQRPGDHDLSVAWEQFELTSYPITGSQISQAEIILSEKDHLLDIQIGSNKVIFDKNMGRIKSVSRNNAVFFEDLSNAFWRAPIDNDKLIQRNWLKTGLHNILSKVINVDVRKGNDYLSIKVKKEHKAGGRECGFRTEETYTISGNGLIKLEVEIDPFGELPVSLPRIGYEARVPSQYSQVSWYGKGFGSSYVDRSEGMKTGIYSGDVESLFINYPVPQENGNRSEVRWMEMVDKDDKGINVSGDQLLNFSVRKYSTEKLTKARHPFELKELPFSVLNIDMEQGPIGNRSCGPEALEKYWLKPDKKKYVIYIRILK